MKPEQKRIQKLVNHCFTCVIKIKGLRQLTVMEDDQHLRESNSRISFHKFNNGINFIITIFKN